MRADVPDGIRAAAGDSRGVRIPARIRAAMERRDSIVSATAGDFERALTALADELARAIEETYAGGSADDIRLAIQETHLEDVIDMLEEMGLDDARSRFADNLAKVERRSIETLLATGYEEADIALDDEAVLAAVDAQYANAQDTLDAKVIRPAAETVLRGLQQAARMESLTEASARVAEQLKVSIPQAATEVRTAVAEFDRYVANQTAEAVAPDLWWGYTGPEDGITRPFCDVIVGVALSASDVRALDNGPRQPGHPMDAGGGYNCRHAWVHGTEEYLKSLGFRVGGDAEVKAANAAARGKQ